MAASLPTENEFGNPAHVESGLRILAQEFVNMKNELSRSLFYPNQKATYLAPESFVSSTAPVLPTDKRLQQAVINADAQVQEFTKQAQASGQPWAVLVSGPGSSLDASKLMPYAGRLVVFTYDPRRVAQYARRDYAGHRADYMPRTILTYGNKMIEAAQAVMALSKPGEEFGKLAPMPPQPAPPGPAGSCPPGTFGYPPACVPIPQPSPPPGPPPAPPVPVPPEPPVPPSLEPCGFVCKAKGFYADHKTAVLVAGGALAVVAFGVVIAKSSPRVEKALANGRRRRG